MPRDVILTPEGLNKLKDELAHLQNDGRREVAERIKEAREFGDISENSEYDHVKDEKTGKSQKFTIVGSAEANPAESKLSNESPVGRALLGHKRNDTVSVPVPKGPARKLKITKIDIGL
jgi:transcription elongation factor GreA